MQNVFKTLSKIVLASLTASLLAGCGAHIKVKDFIAWGDKGKFGATGVHTLCPIDKCPPVTLDRAAWDDKRIGMVCVDGGNFADMQANIDKLCTKNPKTCDYEEVRTGRAALRRINRMLQLAAAYPEMTDLEMLSAMEAFQ